MIRVRHRGRLAAASAVAVAHLLAIATVLGGRVTLPAAAPAPVTVVTLRPEPPPEPPRSPPRRIATQRPAGAAAPPARRAEATPVIALPPVVPPVVEPLAVAALDPAEASAPVQGAAEGPVFDGGAAGVGQGRGAGGTGTGTGGGWWTPPRWRSGRIRGSDYPRAAAAAGVEGSLVTRYTVGPNGRVTDCAVLESSGSVELDATTCRLARERFRFHPARDPDGRKVADTFEEDHRWVLERASGPAERVGSPS